MPVITPEELGNIPFAKSLLKFFGLEAINDHYDSLIDFEGPEFAGRLLVRCGVDYLVGNPQILQKLPEGSFITISNHPHGGVDGVAMVDLLGHVRPDYKFMVNEFLSKVKTLDCSFLTVIPVNDDTNGIDPKNVAALKQALGHIRSGSPLGIFPAGAVSNLKFHKGGIRPVDREWQESVIKFIKKAHVPILPVKFADRNSLLFYFMGLFGWKVRTLFLPRELINKSRKDIHIVLGNIISVEEQDKVANLQDYTTLLRNAVYDTPVPPEDEMVRRSKLEF